MAKMTSTVFTTDPDGAAVRLLEGEEVPKWYDGPATDAKRSDEPRSLEDRTAKELRSMVDERELVVAKSASKDELIAALLAADVPHTTTEG
jgi:hypothetical protein